MKMTAITFNRRRAWELSNDCLRLVIMQGGGHIASVTPAEKPDVNPLWQPPWFAAMNPRLGAVLAYQWRRADFPWVGNREANYGRKTPPCNGKTLSRGMEFTTTPFPVSRREAVKMGRFHDEPTYRRLPARKSMAVSYALTLMPVAASAQGVRDVRPDGREPAVDVD